MTGQYVETPCRTFQAGGAIDRYLRVKVAAGVIAAAGAEEVAVGTIQEAAFASGDMRAVRLRTAQGTHPMVAAAAITINALVYGAAGGKISSTANGNPEGIAMEAASGDESIIEVLPLHVSDAVGAVQGVASGYKMARGVHESVAASDTVVTGLATVVALVACLSDDPVDGCMYVTGTIGDQAGTPAAGSILLKTWKNTDADATHIVADTFGIDINWIAIGT